MRLPSPYRCDYCERPKETSNHWFIRLLDHPALDELSNDAFTVIEWDPDVADRPPDSAGEPTVEHICSDGCAGKALNKWLGERAKARRPVAAAPQEDAAVEAEASV